MFFKMNWQIWMTSSKGTVFYFYEKTLSIHSKRILSILSPRIKFELLDDSQLVTLIVNNEDILIYANIETTPNFLLEKFKLVIGISWAFDLYNIVENDLRENEINTVLNLKKTDLLVVDSLHIAEKAISLGVSPNAIFKMPYGVVLDEFEVIPVSVSSNPFKIYSNRNWEPIYNQVCILKAIQILRDCQFDFTITFAGSGSLLTRLRNEYTKLESSGVVKFLGKIDDQTNRKFLAESDLYLSASLNDGLSVSMLEAQATGIPVLVSNNASNLLWVLDNVNGYLFDKDSPLDLAQKIVYARNNQENRSLIVKNAVTQVQEKADYLKNLTELYDRISQLRVLKS